MSESKEAVKEMNAFFRKVNTIRAQKDKAAFDAILAWWALKNETQKAEAASELLVGLYKYPIHKSDYAAVKEQNLSKAKAKKKEGKGPMVKYEKDHERFYKVVGTMNVEDKICSRATVVRAIGLDLAKLAKEVCDAGLLLDNQSFKFSAGWWMLLDDRQARKILNFVQLCAEWVVNTGMEKFPAWSEDLYDKPFDFGEKYTSMAPLTMGQIREWYLSSNEQSEVKKEIVVWGGFIPNPSLFLFVGRANGEIFDKKQLIEDVLTIYQEIYESLVKLKIIPEKAAQDIDHGDGRVINAAFHEVVSYMGWVYQGIRLNSLEKLGVEKQGPIIPKIKFKRIKVLGKPQV